MFPLRDTEPSHSKPVVTILLIVVNILVFLFEFSLDDDLRNAFISTYGLVPDPSGNPTLLSQLTEQVVGRSWFYDPPRPPRIYRRRTGVGPTPAIGRGPMPGRGCRTHL